MSLLPIIQWKSVRQAMKEESREYRSVDELPHTFFRKVRMPYENIEPCRSRIKRKLPGFKEISSYDESDKIKSQNENI